MALQKLMKIAKNLNIDLTYFVNEILADMKTKNAKLKNIDTDENVITFSNGDVKNCKYFFWLAAGRVKMQTTPQNAIKHKKY